MLGHSVQISILTNQRQETLCSFYIDIREDMSGKLYALIALSAAGVVIMPIFAMLFRYQPKFMHGLNVEAHSAERNCLIVGAIYCGVGILSILILVIQIRHNAITLQKANEDEAHAAHQLQEEMNRDYELARTSSASMMVD